jgi:hypothetical protein
LIPVGSGAVTAAEAVAAREAGKLHRGERAGRAPGGGGNDRACTQADCHEADKRQSPRNAARKPHGGGVHLRNSGRQVYGVPARYHALRRAGSPVCEKGRIGRRQGRIGQNQGRIRRALGRIGDERSLRRRERSRPRPAGFHEAAHRSLAEGLQHRPPAQLVWVPTPGPGVARPLGRSTLVIDPGSIYGGRSAGRATA